MLLNFCYLNLLTGILHLARASFLLVYTELGTTLKTAVTDGPMYSFSVPLQPQTSDILWITPYRENYYWTIYKLCAPVSPFSIVNHKTEWTELQILLQVKWITYINIDKICFDVCVNFWCCYFSKLSTYNDCCTALADCSKFYSVSLAVLNKHPKKQVSLDFLYIDLSCSVLSL